MTAIPGLRQVPCRPHRSISEARTSGPGQPDRAQLRWPRSGALDRSATRSYPPTRKREILHHDHRPQTSKCGLIEVPICGFDSETRQPRCRGKPDSRAATRRREATSCPTSPRGDTTSHRPEPTPDTPEQTDAPAPSGTSQEPRRPGRRGPDARGYILAPDGAPPARRPRRRSAASDRCRVARADRSEAPKRDSPKTLLAEGAVVVAPSSPDLGPPCAPFRCLRPPRPGVL
jgi:hypothetical protein